MSASQGLIHAATRGEITASYAASASAASVLGNQYKVLSASYSAVGGDNLLCDRSSHGITVFLPASPALGDFVTVTHIAGATNTLAVDPQSHAIEDGSAGEAMTIDDANASCKLVYAPGYGWRLTVMG